MGKRFAAALVGLVVVGWLAGCGCRSRSASTAAPEPVGANGPSPEVAAELERLRALGYVDYAPEPAAPEESGVTRHDPSRSHPGYNLYTVRPLGRAELVDEKGELINAWSEDGAQFWARSLLLDNGDLLVVGAKLPDRYVLLLSWDNEVVWRAPLPAHHDARPTPDGRYVTLTLNKRELPAIDPSIPVRDNAITFFEPGPEVVEEISLHDTIAAAPEILPFKAVGGGHAVVDLIHANSVRFMTRKELAARDSFYALGNLVVCMRNQDAVAVLDGERRLVWAWGPDELEGPHDASVLENGHLLIFDNGVRRRWSRAVEVDPASGAMVWEYRAEEPTDFFTAARGAAQRLPNGNTLLTQSNDGRAFEVTPDGEIVWEYFVPHLDAKGHRATIVRLYRYETELVESLLARHSSAGGQAMKGSKALRSGG
jgi:hypothetical protein